MDLKQIKELIQLLEKSGLNKLTIKEKGIEVSLEKGSSGYPQETHHAVKREAPVVIHSAAETPIKPQHVEEEYDLKKAIKSPMVGTFYRAGKPTDPPFVKEGDSVDVGHVLCIIEAMKVMNEIKSTRKGKVVKIFVENGHPVEFGLPLFVIE
jgi:acetyl-CoA carboxylase biotin carboxyl carrier protein